MLRLIKMVGVFTGLKIKEFFCATWWYFAIVACLGLMLLGGAVFYKAVENFTVVRILLCFSLGIAALVTVVYIGHELYGGFRLYGGRLVQLCRDNWAEAGRIVDKRNV